VGVCCYVCVLSFLGLFVADYCWVCVDAFLLDVPNCRLLTLGM